MKNTRKPWYKQGRQHKENNRKTIRKHKENNRERKVPIGQRMNTKEKTIEHIRKTIQNIRKIIEHNRTQ